MPKSYAQLQDKIQALQQKADNARAAAAPYVIRQIKQAVLFYKLTAEDLGLSGTAEEHSSTGYRSDRRAKSLVASSLAKKRTKASAKYRNAEGLEWGGRGPRPQWLRKALSKGSALSDFQVATGARTTQGEPSGTAMPTTAPALTKPESHAVKATRDKRRPARRPVGKSASAPVTQAAKKGVAKRSRTAEVAPSSATPNRAAKAKRRALSPATSAALQSEQTESRARGAGAKKSAPPVARPTQKSAARETPVETKSKASLEPGASPNRQTENGMGPFDVRPDVTQAAAAGAPANGGGNVVDSNPFTHASGIKKKAKKTKAPKRQAASPERGPTGVESNGATAPASPDA